MPRAGGDPGRLRDVCVLGGGVAGLACAVRAAAFGLDVAVCADPTALRSWWAGKVHAHFGFPQGVSGRALLERGLAQAEAAGVERIDGAAISARLREDGTFDVRARTGGESEPPLGVGARFVVLADEPPEVPEAIATMLAAAGLPPPDAFAADETELAGRKVLAFAGGLPSVCAALEAARLAATLTVLAPAEAEELGETLAQRFEAAGARFVRGTPVGVEPRGDGAGGAAVLAAVRLEGGGRLECERALVVPEGRTTILLGAALGLDASAGWIAGDGTGRTAVQGCWVVDGAPPWRSLAEAEVAGARAASDVWAVLQRDRRRARAAALDLEVD